MTDRVSYLIRLAVSMLVTAIVILAIVIFVRLGSKQAQEAVVHVTQMITIDEARYGTDLDGILTGSTVRNLITEYNDGGIYTITTTKAKNTGFYSSYGIDDPSSKNYIKDDFKFTGETIKNDNGVVIAVSFCQIGQEPAVFDLTTAEHTTNTTERNLLQAQFDYYENTKKNLNACIDSVKAYSDYARAVSAHTTARYHELYRETMQENIESANYAYMIPLVQAETNFYKDLENTIKNVWLPNNWFEMLYLASPDFDDWEDWVEPPETENPDDEPDDYDPVEDDGDDDWGTGGIGAGDDEDSDDSFLDDDFLDDYDWGSDVSSGDGTDSSGGTGSSGDTVPIVPPTLGGD